MILRMRVDPEPGATLGPEQSGARADAYRPLAGPFRSLAVQCYDAAGAPVACTSGAAVRAIQVTLVAMDPTGEVADVTVTARAYRQAP